MKNDTIRCFLVALALLFNPIGSTVLANDAVKISPDLTIHYEEQGSGSPIVFIPGWTGSTVYFHQQIAHFSKHYRAITYDPRSQGLSSKTLENNHYVQHGHDLKAFMDALGLEDVILSAHSAGCFDIWSYVRAYGIDNLQAVIALDCAPPKIIRTEESDGAWTDIVEAKDLIGIAQSITYRRRDVMPDFIKSLHIRELTKAEMEMYMSMVMQTPDYVASLLWTDGDYSDYTLEAKLVDTKLPSLWILGEQGGFAEAKRAGVSKILPNAEIAMLQGKHNVHWEDAEQVNHVIDSFLQKLK